METRTLGVVSTLILVRLPIPVDFGIVAMVSAFSFIVTALPEASIGAALVRHLRRDHTLFDAASTPHTNLR